MKTQHTKLSQLLSQHRFDDRRLSASFVEMVGALPARPEPRHIWNNAASPGRVQYRGLVLVSAAQSAMRAAIQTGDHRVIEETARRIRAHFADAETVALRDYHAIVSGHLTLAEARTKASKETTEALHAIVTSTVERNDASELTIKEIDEAIEALSDLRSGMIAAGHPLNDRPRLVRA